MEDKDEDDEEDEEEGKAGFTYPEAAEDFWDEFDLDTDYDPDGADYDEDAWLWAEEGEEEEELENDEEVDLEERIKKADRGEIQYIADEVSVSTVSNDHAPSNEDFDPPDLERGTAQVLPDAPWHSSVQALRKLLLSCLLPFMLLVLLLYGSYQGVKMLFLFLMDIYLVARWAIFTAIRIALFPLYLLWKLIAPEFIQQFVWEKYEAKLGHRIRSALAVKNEAEQLITDIPDILFACAFAGYETCGLPLWKLCKAFCWNCCGTHVYHLVLEPTHNAKINQATAAKKKIMLGHEADIDAAAASHIEMAQRKLKKAKVKARRFKAQRARARRKQQGLQVTLNIPQQKGLNFREPERVQLEDLPDSERKSRVMIVERRYALGVGFGWGCAGLTLLLLTLDGTDGETCTICQEMPELGMTMCRHGSGQDCTFHYHTREVAISCALMGVGMWLLIYAAFLYQPRDLAAKAAEEEAALKAKILAERMDRMRKSADAERQTLNLIDEKLAERTIGKRAKGCYYFFCLTPQYHLDRFGRRILKRVLRFEKKAELRRRAIAVQDTLIFLAYGWAEVALAKLGRFLTYLKNKRKKARKSLQGSGLHSSATGRSILKCLNSNFVTRTFLQFTGLGGTGGSFEEEKKHDVKMKVVGGGKRTAGAGALPLQETLQKFGLLRLEDQATGSAFDPETLMKRGYEEKTLDAGTDDLDEEVLEEYPEFTEEDRKLYPPNDLEAGIVEANDEVHVG